GQQVPPDVDALTGAGRDVTLRGADIAELAAKMRGRLLLAGDDGYDQARRILNPSFDKRPALIARVTGTADIRAAVDFAREHGGLLTAVKCGGHSASGKSTCDGGLMIDLSPFQAVRVDPAARRAHVAGGTLLGLLDHESMSYGLVTTMGTVSHTGVGGLTTGGGFGRVGRHFGLAIDNLVSVDVVTADGELVHADENRNPDLFWGVRGGGGNFGVVTSFEFRLHPMNRQVLAGRIMFPLSRARDVLDLYAEYGPRAPDPLQMDFGMFTPPGGEEGAIGFSLCWSGDHAAADRALAPIRDLGSPAMDQVQAMDYVALQRSGDIDDPRARASYLKSGFVTEITPALIDAIVDGFEGDPARATAVFAQQSGGAIGRVAPDATAFSQRDAQINLLGSVDWPFGTDGSEHIAWMRSFWTGVEPHTQGFYINDTGLERTETAIIENFRENRARLVQVKNRWDPGNLFRLNTNIEPTV
ncbi:MAG TPA: FAD-binding protein, partial [Longimicrobiales bacterium]|nr:FAD-binding protein [Longimicrobiales bacterium]